MQTPKRNTAATGLSDELRAIFAAEDRALTVYELYERSRVAENPGQIAKLMHYLVGTHELERLPKTAHGDRRKYRLVKRRDDHPTPNHPWNRAPAVAGAQAPEKQPEVTRLTRERIRDRRQMESPLGKAPERLLPGDSGPVAAIHGDGTGKALPAMAQADTDRAGAELDVRNAIEGAAERTATRPQFAFFSSGSIQIVHGGMHLTLDGEAVGALVNFLADIRPALERALDTEV